MSKNRVEKLESTVAELESTVDGLTDELIEAKERIRVLEAELDTETPTRVPDRRASEETAEAQETQEAAPDEVEQATADADDDADATPDEAEDSGSDDIIVA
ncbi:hypothetical protein SAMN04487967_0591 [Natronorubrum sediminis]|uniref:Chromosome segregation protein SMC n=1 Tax=Natronorubrum sediminis TaxID=640943 RepID=A0A1H6FP37_9EURY|nr:hypothetical protein [Natronorubrum sediminis]SEH11960.1 hypothetical protein SAMN04487967_0591 [Natronorubrum sediminis]